MNIGDIRDFGVLTGGPFFMDCSRRMPTVAP
jgi:hypothetical protein